MSAKHKIHDIAMTRISQAMVRAVMRRHTLDADTAYCDLHIWQRRFREDIDERASFFNFGDEFIIANRLSDIRAVETMIIDAY